MPASFSFIGPIISTGMLGGLPLIFGVCIAAAPVEMVISRLLRYTQKVITPLVSGIVVTLIGMSLIKVGIIACGGAPLEWVEQQVEAGRPPVKRGRSATPGTSGWLRWCWH